MKYLSKLTIVFFLLTMAGVYPAFAAVTDTGAGITIDNTAEIEFSVGGSPTLNATSTTASFVVDHKVRPVVAPLTLTPQPVVAGSTSQYLAFTVTNDGNSAAALPIVLSNEQAGALVMTNIAYYQEDGTTPGFQAAEDTPVPGPTPTINVDRDPANALTIYIVGDAPVGATAGQTGTYHLIATANVAEAATDTLGVSDNVYADDAGTSTGDVAYNGLHSANALFEVVDVTLTAAKSSSVISDGVNSGPPYFRIPGSVIEYRVEITNTSGLLPASNVTLTDEIPANLIYVADSVEIDGTAYADASAQVTYVAGPPEQITVTLPTDLAISTMIPITFRVTIE